ncbi:tetratricopeptide repeat protein [Alteromonas pelagimontana]|uniref:Tetratricopeptide repeat protein n=1 Tax=Alteromonas pelagimontana TaxID=1858656 RepID=A0A6M4MEQ9_9ALTE|nr:tetratricopeptide repeat protein [Alteromonas pelagimontana]QJR81563.1 tetratricopeptide repeat protein [Alteromonas pelagimontana]
MAVRLVFLSILLLQLAACASSQQPAVVAHPVLQDSLFPSYTIFAVESEADIFYLDENAQQFVNSVIKPKDGDRENMRTLVKQIFDHSEKGLLYRGNANSVAWKTFEEQAANCLSLSIMTYAMAEYAGLDAQFYQVEIPEYWTRREGYNLLNGHINMRISANDPAVNIISADNYVDVDFDPQALRSHFPRQAISKREVVAMFYNNKGADALLDHSYTKAYAYFRQAALLQPDFGQVWVNLGVLYRMNDAPDAAEKSYRQALALEADNLTAWENLAILYRHTGQIDEAEAITASVEKKRESNPFYHYILGEQALEEEKYEQALTHYRRAMQLNRSQHEVLFGLGKTYYELGDVTLAKKYLELAARYAPNLQDENRYRGKLSALQSAR